MSEWSLIRLGALAEVKGGKRLPKGELLTSIPSAHPYVRITDMQGKWLNINENTVYVNPSIQHAIRNYTVDRGDVILSIVGHTIGLVARIGETLHKANLTENCVKILPDSAKLDKDFIYYFLVSNIGQSEIDSKIVGSSQPKLPLYNIKGIELPFPSLPEQKAIASVLSSLDDKIDLLHRQNKTLEAMAETLFRQWFIEEAKEDWEDGTLDQLIDLKYGKALKQEDRSGSGYPVVASSGIVGFHNDYLVKGPGIVIGRKGTLGKVYFMEDNFYPIDTSYFIQTKTSGSNLIFEYYLLKSLDFANMNSDSAVPGLNRNIALGTQIQVPPEELILSFNETTQPWFSKIHSNTKQIQTLENLRDTLLPKLMSGEVRVQYQTEEVA